MRLSLPALCLALAACDGIAGDAWLVAEAPSPDGRLVARLWCPDSCDVAGLTRLTISAASTAVPITPSEVKGFPPTGPLPEADRAGSFHAGHVVAPGHPDGLPTSLRWAGPARLEIRAPRPLGANGTPKPSIPAFRGVRISLCDIAPGGGCR